MKAWVSHSDVITKLGYKILLAGLSESGKTAVKRIFFLQHQTEDVEDLLATLNFERLTMTIRDVPITIIDLGGQRIFVKRFLSGLSPFVFSSVKSLIFLVDVSNKTGRNDAIQFFAACVEKIQEYSPEAEAFVFLHKNDLVRNFPKYESIHEQLKEQFQLEYPNKLRFFRTTIYKPESVIDSFGRIFEITMPEIAWSKYVDERTVGSIEEFADKSITLRDPKVETVKDTETAKISQNTSTAYPEKITMSGIPRKIGDLAAKEKLERLIQEKIKPKSEITQPFLSRVKIEETHQGVKKATNSSLDPSIRPDIQQINRFIDYYQMGLDEATEIVHSGYSDVFEIAASSGIKIQIIVNVLLKYIPFIKSQGLNIKTLDQELLLDLFSVYLRGLVKENDLTKCLIFAAERPTMSIEEIALQYLRKKERKDLLLKETVINEEIEKKPYEVAEFNISIETEIIQGIVVLPNFFNVGFRIELVGVNALLNLYYQGRSIGRSTISPTITADEIRYLIGYEMNMNTLDSFKGGTTSINFVAEIISETLRILRERNFTSTTELSKILISSKGDSITNKLRYVLPVDIRVLHIIPEGEFYLIPDTKGIAFSISKVEKGYLLKFIQKEAALGQITIKKAISAQLISKIMKDEIQLPLEPNIVLFMAGLIVNTALKSILRADSTLTTKPTWITRKIVQSD